MRPEFDLSCETNTQLLAHFGAHDSGLGFFADGVVGVIHNQATLLQCMCCLLYTSDAADE